MEYRKLISFGKNSYVISLPKTWVRLQKLCKGDLVSVEESPTGLLLSKKSENQIPEDKEKIVLVDGRDVNSIEREVCAAYIQNHSRIIFKGKEIKSKVRELQRVIQNLIALEIMEQTSEMIIAKDFLNMETVSMEELLRKMDIVTRTMINEASMVFEEDNYDDLNQRDLDVNRLYFLLYRAALYNLEHPLKAVKHFNLSPSLILKVYRMAFYIEAIADEARRVARYARQPEVKPKQQKEIKRVLLRVQDYYITMMKAYYGNDHTTAIQISDQKTELYSVIKELEGDIGSSKYFNRVVNRLQRMVSLIHNMGRVVYTIG